ncbi:BamA/TamA family outer membrane protein [uncultured Chitinophaga sp.]|uniref:translocation and assembly module lipoprotein TamL n=1 Tax=uncultured Chitinophaga sp. TaxID=339340 RepID=UPI0025D2FD55|nr:BamA/TamA family outer membrane protein [uncultured Chitinophaga sp.]
MRKTVILHICLVMLCACSVQRHMPEGEKLYGGNEIVVLKSRENTAGDVAYVRKRANNLALQRENGTFLTFPLSTYFYYRLGDSAKDNRFRKWLRKSIAEVPLTDKTMKTELHAKLIQSMLQHEGFFNSTVMADTVHRRYKAIERYTIHLTPRHYLAAASFNADSTPVRQALDSLLHTPASQLQTGAPYRLDDFKSERERLSYEMKKKGYYYLEPAQLTSIADTFGGLKKVNLIVDLTQPIPPKVIKPYRISRISIYPDYTVNSDSASGQSSDGIQVYDPKYMFKPDMFKRLISYRPGDLYNIEEQERSFNRLYGTGAFKFVTSRIIDDSTGLQVRYDLTPLPKQSIQFETGGNTKSNNSYGLQLATSWSNRNTFKRGEVLYLRLEGGADLQYAGKGFVNYNYRAGAETGIAFPRFLIPFVRNEFGKAYNVRTVISTGYDLLIRSSFYNVHAYKLNYNYAWKTNAQTDFSLSPISINYVQNYKVTEEDITNPNNFSYQNLLKAILSNELIIGPQFNYGYNSLTSTFKRQHFAFTGNIETAGNILSLIKRPGSNGDTQRKEVLGVPYSQYAKTDLDFRYYYRIKPRIEWASRVFAGVGIPYRNSTFVPVLKQYQAGGSNGIRAFRQNTLGPGAYHVPDTLPAAVRNFFRNAPQTGDIKLEFNTELRFSATKMLQAAAFIDAGNIWVARNTFVYDLAEAIFDTTRTSFSNKKFSSKFYKELGIGGGLGLRLDFSFIVVRADVAMPFHKPWLPEGERWVFNRIEFLSPEWRRDNLVVNFGIGYPF